MTAREFPRNLRFPAALLIAVVAIAMLAGCSTTRATITARRHTSCYLPAVRKMMVVLDMARLFQDYEIRQTDSGDGLNTVRRDTFYLPMRLGRSLMAGLADHGTEATCAFLGFASSGHASVDSVARDWGAEAAMWVTCPLYTGEYRATLASLLGFSPSAFGESPALRVEELDLDLKIPGTARPDRNAWAGYMQIERGTGGAAAFADSIAAVIVRQLAADGVIGPRVAAAQ